MMKVLARGIVSRTSRAHLNTRCGGHMQMAVYGRPLATVRSIRRFGSSEDRRRDETLAGIRVCRGESFRQRDADRAHGDVDRALA